MPPDRKLTLTLLGLVALGFLVAPAGAVAQQPFDRLVSGTWLMMVTIPPNPLMGNSQDIVMPEYATFGVHGTGLEVASAPGFPFPIDGDVGFALATDGALNWERDGRRLLMTQWRFVMDPTTGAFLGFFKLTAEGEAAGRNRLEGEYVLELLDPQLQPLTLGGQELTLRGSFVGTRVAVERMPRR